MDIPEALNADFMDAQYRLWKNNPLSVTRDWQFFFEGFRFAADGRMGTESAGDDDQGLRQSKVEALKYRYRDIGHLLACMDPLEACPIDHPLLNISAFDLTLEDLERPFYTRRFSETRQAPLKEIIKNLKETYSRSVGVEYMHLQDPSERQWLQDRMEPVRNHPEPNDGEKRRILKKLQQAAIFEQFLNKKYIAVTRFSIEGGDVIIPMLDTLIDHTAGQGVVFETLNMSQLIVCCRVRFC